MDTDQIPDAPTSEWNPEADLETVALIGKLGEEASELATICFRILIQGLDELEPKTLKPNREALKEEMADVQAMLMHLIDRRMTGLDLVDVGARRNRKFAYKRPWFDFLKGKTR